MNWTLRAAVGCIVLGMIFGALMFANISGGPKATRRALLWGGFAPDEVFTARGRTYRALALICGLLGILLLLIAPR